MSTQDGIEGLWPEDMIKRLMSEIAEERPMRSFMDTASTSTNYGQMYEPYRPKRAIKKPVEKKKEEPAEPMIFDPKELDIDDP